MYKLFHEYTKFSYIFIVLFAIRFHSYLVRLLDKTLLHWRPYVCFGVFLFVNFVFTN